MSDGPVFERYLTEAEEGALFTHVRQFGDVLARRDAAWMALLRQTGIRVKACSMLDVHNAREALRTNYLVLDPTYAKGGKGGQVYVNKKAKAALRTLLAIRKEMGHPDKADEPLIMSRNHRRISVRSLQSRMARWVNSAGLSVQASPHWMRHTLGRRIVKNSTADNPLGVAQRALNHSDIRSTSVYTAPGREDYENTMEEAS